MRPANSLTFRGALTARTFLFVPGSQPQRFAKAEAALPDVVLIDLEDAVAQRDKEDALAHAVAWLSGHRSAVRVNTGSRQRREIAELANCSGLDAVVLPKCESLHDIDAVARLLPDPRVALLALIETAAGGNNAQQIADHPRVDRLIFGNVDYCLDLGLTPTAPSEPELQPIRSQLVLASRVAGIAAPVDGVVTTLNDTATMKAAARMSRANGFTGRLCLHPRQVDHAHEGLAPSEPEIAWAERILAASGESSQAVRIGAEMVDAPVIERARNIMNWPLPAPLDAPSKWADA
jgi:citrate lyase subunit beta / citryl-CoA lyase